MPQHRIGKVLPPPQQRPAPRRQLMKAERLQQTIIRAQVQALAPAPQPRCAPSAPAPLSRRTRPRISASTSVPSFFGRLRSSTIRSGRCSRACSSAARHPPPNPPHALPASNPSAGTPQRSIIFHNQNSHQAPSFIARNVQAKSRWTLRRRCSAITLVHQSIRTQGKSCKSW